MCPSKLLRGFVQLARYSVRHKHLPITKLGCSNISDHPQDTSSPHNISWAKQPKTIPKRSQRLTVLNINCQSIKNKVPEFHQVIDQDKPNIIVGTESWLKPEIGDAEIFPTNTYNIYGKDRANKKGGGVFLAITKDFISEEQPELDTNCEISGPKLALLE